MSQEEKVADRFLVQVPDDLKAVCDLPLAEKIIKVTLGSCGKPPKGKVVEKSTLIDVYGIKRKKLIVDIPEYFTTPSVSIEEPDLELLFKTYENMNLNPKIKMMKIKDGVDGEIIWRSGANHLTAIARNGRYLTEEQALALAKEVGGKVCTADVIRRKLDFEIIRCAKP